ncbi:MAG: DUF1972 domain-containing protein [Anaeroplasmataceae bacterium]|nr:DUF1972 domain-containing protein [Anaeroplasmataceae bacterium]
MKHIFIVGSKGIPGKYGGYETFVDKLTEYHQANDKIKYHVACLGDDSKEFEYHNARCFTVKVPNVGPAKAILYDLNALKNVCRYVKKNNITDFIVYILACRIGPFMKKNVKKIHHLGGVVYINPDGHEWLRAKWSKPVRQYWKKSEQKMVKYADFIVCDSLTIEQYIQKEYAKYNPKTTFIAYGAEVRKSSLADDDSTLMEWYNRFGLKKYEYYCVVGRFVPENNYETMIREFMLSNTTKDFVIVTNVSSKFLDELQQKTNFKRDNRIKFVGTVYDKELIKKIRENAYGYFHGHEVGGTNPSLLEALASTQLNLLLDVGFNKEVAEDSALYWTKEAGNLSKLIEESDALPAEEIDKLSVLAKERISKYYSWEYIAALYEKIFS